MKYRDENKVWHSMEEDILSINYEHEHPLVKEDHVDKITVWCPICDIVFGVILPLA